MEKTQKNELKHLGFVRVTAINTIMWLSSLYDYAKQNSGSLKSAVVTVEGAVTNVVTPVFDKFKGVPDQLLAFLDQKVDVVSAKFDEHAPTLVKDVANQVHIAIQKATEVTKEIVHEAQVGGPLAAAQYAAKESKDIALDQSVKVWCKLDQLSLFHTMAELTVPTAAHFSEKYNKLITNFRRKGYNVFCYVPLVPADDIAKAYKQYKDGNSSGVSSPPASVAASE